MRYFFFKNSNEQTKNMFGYVEKSILDAARGEARYSFAQEINCMYSCFVDNSDNLVVIHKSLDQDTYKDTPYPYKSFNLNAIANILDENDTIHLVYADCPDIISDVQMLSGARLAIMDTNGDLLDVETRVHLTTKRMSKSNILMSGFKLGSMPIYLFITHSPYIGNNMVSDTVEETYKSFNILPIESIKSRIFPCNIISGSEATIANNFIFANSSKLIIQLVDVSVINPEDIDFTTSVSVETSCPYTIDQINGRLYVDISNMSSKTSTPLTISINAGSFLSGWIYDSQRFSYNWVVYKV